VAFLSSSEPVGWLSSDNNILAFVSDQSVSEVKALDSHCW
jgi:hypothetical protein